MDEIESFLQDMTMPTAESDGKAKVRRKPAKVLQIEIDGEKETIEAIGVEGDFALHGVPEWKHGVGIVPSKDCFTITHIPTGAFILNNIGDKSAAKDAFTKLAKAKSFSEGLALIHQLKKDLVEKRYL